MSEQTSTFAQFWRCALQVNNHLYSGKYRGIDHGMDAQSYAESLREICEFEGIKVVGLADHSSIADADIIRRTLTDFGIVVFPGFEIATTEKVHWVCLFPEDTSAQKIERYLGILHLTNTQDTVMLSELAGKQMLTIVENEGGFCFAAHVTSTNGLLKNKFPHLWKDPRVRAAQIPGNVDDLPPEYRKIVLNKNPDYWRERPIAIINSKDVAKPEDLHSVRASTYIKMTRPCFASFFMAFKDPESRVRLSDDIEEHYYSQIESVTVEGGYFDGLTTEISGHLNTVIGGRGTGKSTMLECIRYALDVPHKGEEAIRQGDQIVSANLGQDRGRVIMKLRSAANHMKRYTIIRRYGEPPRVIDEDGNESQLHPSKDLLPGVEIYGQNEIYELAKSPDAFTKILDRFLPEITEQQARLDLAYRKLKENGERLTKEQERMDNLENQLAKLPRLEEQVRQFKEHGVEEKLMLVPLLEKERQMGPRILEEITQIRTGQRGLEESLPDLVFLSDTSLKDLPHTRLLLSGRGILKKLSSMLHDKLDEMDKAIGEAELKLVEIVNELTREMKITENEIVEEFSKLPSIAGKDGKAIGREYQRLLREIEQVKPARVVLRTIDNFVVNLEQTRRNLLGEISDIRSARTSAKQAAIKKLNKRLAGKIRIKLVPDGLRKPLRNFLKGMPGVGERKTDWVDEAQDLTILGLVTAIREGCDALLAKEWGLTSGLAQTLIRMTPEQLYQLEGIDIREQVNLELNVSHSSEKYKPLEYLSTGQQGTAILHLLLLDNLDPLIMDQPEDNLDNAFIAKRIVQELRSAKTDRQFLFATHNANIPVFGDAEWIGVCSASDEQAEMPLEAQGSIDIPAIRDQVANILEGGKEAFMLRKEKYGFDY